MISGKEGPFQGIICENPDLVKTLLDIIGYAYWPEVRLGSQSMQDVWLE